MARVGRRRLALIALLAALVMVAGIATAVYFAVLRPTSGYVVPDEVGVIVYSDPAVCGADGPSGPGGTSNCGAVITRELVDAPAFPLLRSNANVYINGFTEGMVYKITIWKAASPELPPHIVFRTNELPLVTQGCGLFTSCHRFDMDDEATFMRVETT